MYFWSSLLGEGDSLHKMMGPAWVIAVAVVMSSALAVSVTAHGLFQTALLSLRRIWIHCVPAPREAFRKTEILEVTSILKTVPPIT